MSDHPSDLLLAIYMQHLMLKHVHHSFVLMHIPNTLSFTTRLASMYVRTSCMVCSKCSKSKFSSFSVVVPHYENRDHLQAIVYSKCVRDGYAADTYSIATIKVVHVDASACSIESVKVVMLLTLLHILVAFMTAMLLMFLHILVAFMIVMLLTAIHQRCAC